MQQKIEMPKLGESVTEGIIDKWLVKIGDKVKQYQPLADVTTDKVSAEIPSLFDGEIIELIAKEGESYEVGSVICIIETADTKAEQLEDNIVTPQSNVQAVNTEGASMKGRYSPAVLKLAAEHEISLEGIKGTGTGNRITRKDVLNYIANKDTDASSMMQMTDEHKVVSQNEPVQAAEVQQPLTTKYTEQEVSPGDRIIPVSSIRKKIAQNMVKSVQEIPHAWMMVEVDVTDLVQYRDEIKQDFMDKEGFPITYFAFFVKAVAQALKEFPMLNSMWLGDKIIQKQAINISIAVSSEDALFVPVIKNVDEKSIKGIAREITELAQLARSGKLRMEHLEGGTFTVNNTGAFGSVQSMGIINAPQVAILQVENITLKPVLIQGNMIAPRYIVNLCLSLDHRILDGLICGKFLARVKDILENTKKHKMSVY